MTRKVRSNGDLTTKYKKILPLNSLFGNPKKLISKFFSASGKRTITFRKLKAKVHRSSLSCSKGAFNTLLNHRLGVKNTLNDLKRDKK